MLRNLIAVILAAFLLPIAACKPRAMRPGGVLGDAQRRMEAQQYLQEIGILEAEL